MMWTRESGDLKSLEGSNKSLMPDGLESALRRAGVHAVVAYPATREDVAELVGVEESELEALMRPGTEAGSGYVEFEVPKRSGGVRRISAPRQALKEVQRALLDQVLARPRQVLAGAAVALLLALAAVAWT